MKPNCKQSLLFINSSYPEKGNTDYKKFYFILASIRRGEPSWDIIGNWITKEDFIEAVTKINAEGFAV